MLAALLDLVFPRRCLGCARPAVGLCSNCRNGRPQRRYVDDIGWVYAAGSYRSALGVAVVHFKDRRRRDLVAALGAVLGDALLRTVRAEHLPNGTVVVVPVPSGPAAAAERGGDHMRRLAAAAGRRAGLQVCSALAATAHTDSVALGAAARRANVAGTLRCVRPPAHGQVAVLVDDVLTTGATLREAAATLRQAGWTVVAATVITAVADPRAARTGGSSWTAGVLSADRAQGGSP